MTIYGRFPGPKYGQRAAVKITSKFEGDEDFFSAISWRIGGQMAPGHLPPGHGE